MTRSRPTLPPYRQSLAGTLLAAREAVMAPIRPILREAGVTEQQWRVLRVLADEGEVSLSRLAQLALLHGPSVTRIRAELLSRRLVVRIIDPDDARRSLLGLSPRGRALLAAIIPRTAAVLESYRQAFGSRRLAALVAELAEFSASVAPFSPRAGTAAATPEAAVGAPRRTVRGRR